MPDCEVAVPDYGLFDACGSNAPLPVTEPPKEPEDPSGGGRRGLSTPAKVGLGVAGAILLITLVLLLVKRK